MSVKKLAWVTGASTGIGRAVALQLAESGWWVAASARSADKLEALSALNKNIFPCPLDIRDAAAVNTAVQKITRDYGAIDLALLNAGGWAEKKSTVFSAANIRGTFDLNVMGTVNCIEAVLPNMLARHAGHIALVASVAGYRGLPGAAGYCASKAALINLAETLHIDYTPQGIKVQVINPGFVRTPLTEQNDFPMPFIIDADDAGRRIVRGLNRNVFEITFPRRFTWLLKLGRMLPDGLYFNLVARTTRGKVRFRSS